MVNKKKIIPLPAINKVFVIYKMSVYQRYVLEKKDPALVKKIKAGHHSTKLLQDTHTKHMRALETITDALSEFGVPHKMTDRTSIKSFKGYDLIITVGGDGTFLRTSHYVNHQLMLGINSVPSLSVGALCSLKINQIKSQLGHILKGDYQIHELNRMSIKLNSEALPLEPINDVLYTNISPAATSRYILELDKISEEHKSSGIWVSTPLGSTAAINAAGGMKQPPHSRRLQYLTREPYQGIYNPYQLVRGFVEPTSRLKITSKMIRSKLYLDGPTRSFNVEYGDDITIQLSQNRLKRVIPSSF